MATFQVTAGANDCYRRLTTPYWDLTYDRLEAGSASGDVKQIGCGMRFVSVMIPRGTTISEAHLTLRAFESRDEDVVRSRISAEDVDDAAIFADDGDAFDTRWAARTTARVDWDSIGSWVAGTDYDSPDIKTVIQEIVDRPGWNSGQDMVIFWEDFDGRSDLDLNVRRVCYSYEGSTTYAPKLVITAEQVYPTPGSGELAGLTRVTNLIHRYNRNTGVYTLEMALGEVTSDFGLPEWLTMPQPAVPEEEAAATFQQRMDTTAKQLQEEADMSREEALRIARKLETLEEAAKQPIGPIPVTTVEQARAAYVESIQGAPTDVTFKGLAERTGLTGQQIAKLGQEIADIRMGRTTLTIQERYARLAEISRILNRGR